MNKTPNDAPYPDIADGLLADIGQTDPGFSEDSEFLKDAEFLIQTCNKLAQKHGEIAAVGMLLTMVTRVDKELSYSFLVQGLAEAYHKRHE